MSKLREEIQQLIKEDLELVRLKQKSEAEVRQFETPTNLSEPQRLLHLLSSGRTEQKLSVLRNLPQQLHYSDVYKETIPFIINSLNQWDREFHNEVCSLIESSKVIEIMPEHDAEQFLRRFVAILNTVNAKLYLSFVRRVLRVCGILIKKINFQTTTSVCLTTIKQFLNSRNAAEERAIGFDLLYSIAEVHRNDFFGKSTTLSTLYQKMANDSNWCLRKRFIANAIDFLIPTTKDSELNELTRSIFATFFEKPIIMALQDDNLNVAFEALKVIHEYPHLFDPELYEEMYKPLVAKLLKTVQKGSSEPTLRIEFSRVQGHILDLLKKNRLLDSTLARSFFLFFKSCVSEDDPVTEGFTTETDEDLDYAHFSRRPQELQNLMVNAMYNLPCFYLHLDGGGVSGPNGQSPPGNEAVASKSHNKQGPAQSKQAPKQNQATTYDYQEDLLTLAQKVSLPDQTDVRAKEILIKCFHELLAIKTNKSYQTKLLQILEDLIVSSSERQSIQLQTTLCQHLGDIIGSFAARPEHAALTRQYFSLRNQNLKKCKAEFFLQDLCIKLNIKSPISPTATTNTKDTALAQKEVAYPPSLAKFIQLECVHEEFSSHELANHRLLELIAKLFRHLISTPQRSFKNIATLLSAVSFNIKYFNAGALDNFFTQKLLDYLENAPECIVPELLQFFLRLIHVQYREGLKDALLQTLIDKLLQGNAKARIRFINLCEFAVEILDLATFAAHFMPLLETGFSTEKTPSVIKAYLQGFLTIWETLNDVGSDELVLQFNDCLKQQRSFPEELRTLAVDVRTKVRLCIEKAEKEPSLTKQRRENAQNLIDRETAVRERLAARHTYETEVAGFVQKEQENKKLLTICQSFNIPKPVSKGSGQLPNTPQPRRNNTEKQNVWFGQGTAPAPKTKPALAEQRKPIANQALRSGKEGNQPSKSPSTTKTTPGPASHITSGRYTPKLELQPIKEDSASPETTSINQRKILQEKCLDTGCSSAAFYSLPIEKDTANKEDPFFSAEKIETIENQEESKHSLGEQELCVSSIVDAKVSYNYILEVRTPFEESEDSIVEVNQAVPETLTGTPLEEQRGEHTTQNEDIPEFNFVNQKLPREQLMQQDIAKDEQASLQEVVPNQKVVGFNTRNEKNDSARSKGLLSSETLECFIINQRKAIEKQASNIALWQQETRNSDLKIATPQPVISPQKLVQEPTTVPVRTPGRLESIYLKNHKAQLQALKTLRQIQTIKHSTASSGSISIPKGSSSAYRQLCSRLSCSSPQQMARFERQYPNTARDKDHLMPPVRSQLQIRNGDAQIDQQAIRRAGFVGNVRQKHKIKTHHKLITSPSLERVNENAKTHEQVRDKPNEPHNLIVELTTRGLFTERKERMESKHAIQHKQKVSELISLSPFASQFANGAENPRVVSDQSPHSRNAANEGYQSVEFQQSTNPLLSYKSPMSGYKKYKKNMSLRELCEVAKYCSVKRQLSLQNLRLDGLELKPIKANAKQQVHLSLRNLKTPLIEDLKTNIKNERYISQLSDRYKSMNFEAKSLSQEMLSFKVELIDKLKQPKILPPRNIEVLQLLRRKKKGPQQVLYEKVGKRLKLQPVAMVIPGSFVDRQLENNMLLKSQRLDQGRSSRLEQLVVPEMLEQITHRRNELHLQDSLTHRRLICN